ncbi:UNVERIFIED_CONTAM: hypothetical protein Slati_3103900 [Sesamum latifolium]|uniref:DUF4283 domain-containing protein n=1 Tax=Sesamum latifolium TaxID=2727402 RepID=A0AAW2UX12_9LAMI
MLVLGERGLSLFDLLLGKIGTYVVTGVLINLILRPMKGGLDNDLINNLTIYWYKPKKFLIEKVLKLPGLAPAPLPIRGSLDRIVMNARIAKRVGAKQGMLPANVLLHQAEPQPVAVEIEAARDDTHTAARSREYTPGPRSASRSLNIQEIEVGVTSAPGEPKKAKKRKRKYKYHSKSSRSSKSSKCKSHLKRWETLDAANRAEEEQNSSTLKEQEGCWQETRVVLAQIAHTTVEEHLAHALSQHGLSHDYSLFYTHYTSTHTNPTSSHALTAIDDNDEDGKHGAGDKVEGGTLTTLAEDSHVESSTDPDQNLDARIQSEFNFPEFLLLANRVIDDGDASAMAALHAIQAKWKAKFGSPVENPPWKHATEAALSAVTALDGSTTRVSALHKETTPRVSSPPPTAATTSPFTPTTSPIRSEDMNDAAPVNRGSPSMKPGLTTVDLNHVHTTGLLYTLAFNNSSRKTLSFIPPALQNGEVIVRSFMDIIREGSRRWVNTAVGYFLGKKPYFHHLHDYVHSVWPMVQSVTATTSGFYFFQFKTEAAMEEVIEGGPWLFQGQPIVLQRWEPSMALRKLKHTQVPVWIKLRHLPVELWTVDGLSTIASGIGKPLYPDAVIMACTRLDFARVCIMLDVTSKLPKHLVVMVPKEDGTESPCKIDVEYEWLPLKCTTCHSLGHPSRACPTTKQPTKTPVSVYVPRPKEGMPTNLQYSHPRKSMLGKEIVVHNTFEALSSYANDDDVSRGPNACSPVHVPHDPLATWNVRGLNRRDHQLACIHCRVHAKRAHEVALVTIVYDFNEVIPRCTLWAQLALLMEEVGDEPWLVLGDFNLVINLSEVCGTSGDISMAMNDFRSCLLDTGLLLVPIQGAVFMWHNCSEGSRSLSKRLDRMLANDRWLARWPDTICLSSTPRTSDHSPLVLSGYSHRRGGGLFRFDKFLARNPGFLALVEGTWRHNIHGTPMYSITRKLKLLKPLFRACRKNKGDLSANVAQAKAFLVTVQTLLLEHRHNELLIHLDRVVRLVLLKASKLEQAMLQQRAKIQWLKGGISVPESSS